MNNSRLALVAGLSLMLAAACGGTPDESSKATADVDGETLGTTSEALSVQGAIGQSKQKGLQTVDPMSLNPPAEIEDEPWFAAIPYDKCWRTGGGITCVALPRTWQVGDGSLEGAGGTPQDFGIVCDAGHPLYLEYKNTWAIVRYYDAAGNMLSRYRLESARGTVYNATNGKSATMWWDDLFISTFSVPGGAPENETIKIIGNDWSVKAKGGKRLAHSYGSLTFFPDGNFEQTGKHPLNDYFFGDSSGIAPVCDHLQ